MVEPAAGREGSADGGSKQGVEASRSVSPTHGSWQAVYIAPNETVGSRVKDALTRRGFLVMLRCGGTSGPGGSAACEVLVPALEAEEAHQAVTDLRRGVGGAGK